MSYKFIEKPFWQAYFREIRLKGWGFIAIVVGGELTLATICFLNGQTPYAITFLLLALLLGTCMVYDLERHIAIEKFGFGSAFAIAADVDAKFASYKAQATNAEQEEQDGQEDAETAN